MNELIKIEERNGAQLVNARDLHQFLIIESENNVVGEKFADWIKRVLEFGFEKDVDYTTIDYNYLGTEIRKSDNQHVSKRDYFLTMDCAKEISMVQRNDKGKQARQYFIEVEKQFRAATTASCLTMEDMMIIQLQSIKEQKEKIRNLEAIAAEAQKDIFDLKVKTTTRPSYFTVVGYATLKGVKVNVSIAADIGRKSAKSCYYQHFPIDKVNDPRFGSVGLYPEEVLSEIFKNMELC